MFLATMYMIFSLFKVLGFIKANRKECKVSKTYREEFVLGACAFNSTRKKIKLQNCTTSTS